MNKQLSSFTQTKGLLWREQYEAILKRDFKPPVGAVIDLTDRCNLKCGWCNAQAYRSPNTLFPKHVKKIIDQLARWGVKSVCYAGGGEPSLHYAFAELIKYSVERGLQVGISTNGTALTLEQIEAIAEHAHFCGISVDAGTSETWRKLKHLDLWEQLMGNAHSLAVVAAKTKLDLTYKIMLTPENQYEVLEGCKIAKGLGFKSFFVRPASYENVPVVERTKYCFDVNAVQRQLEECSKLESDRFKVYSNFSRVTEDFHRTLGFSKCQATPLMAVYCADGFSYLCIDYRERPYGKLCLHLQLKKFWNSVAHHKIVDAINLDRCPRCAFGSYNSQIEAFAADYFYMNFP